MSDGWSIERSLVTSADRDLAWAYMSNVQNLADMEGVTIELDGPFRTGTKGRTISPQLTQAWTLSEVTTGIRFVITGEQGGLTLHFAWDFEDAGTGTRMTQRIHAEGTAASLEQWKDVLRQMEAGAPHTMRRLTEKLNAASAAK